MVLRLRRAIALLLMAACLGASVSCHRGPDDTMLEQTLQGRLDETFGADFFKIDELRRMGSASYSGAADNAGGVHVYYNALIELQQDYSLTSWKGLNLGTLAFVVGATESGIRGFKPKGNAKGDRLQVHGRLSFSRHGIDEAGEGGEWKIADASGPALPKPELVGQDLGRSGPAATLGQVRELLGRSPSARGGAKDAAIVGELQRAVSRIDLRLSRIDGKLRLGAGPSPGTYHAFGAALGAHASHAGLPIFSFDSEGSLENAALMQDRALDFALVQSDVAEVVHRGWADEGIIPNRNLRAVASLWPEAVHLVTLEETGISSMSDLRGRRVAIGQTGSGTRFNAVRISLAAGITGGDEPDLRRISLAAGIEALEAGEIDALFVTEAIPSPALQAFAARRADLRFVSIDEEIVSQLSEAHFAYYPRTVEAHTYPEQQEAFHTLGLACTLVTSTHVEPDTVNELLELLVDDADELSDSYFRAGFISADTMRLGLAVPLHEGAERFYDARESARKEAAATAEAALPSLGGNTEPR